MNKQRIPTSYNLYISTEFAIDKKITINPAFGCWVSYGYFASGLSIIYYTRSINNPLVIRPALGADFKRVKLMYGFNQKSKTAVLSNFNTHVVEITWTFRKNVLIRLKQ